MSVCFHYHFHSVGQGLFASGCIYEPNLSEPRYLWVFDCGSSSFKKATYWRKEACTLKAFVSGKRQIDLLSISHFDEDHINGVTELLKIFEVDTLLLPYVSLNKRIQIAFGQGVQPGDAIFSFFINPGQFLRDIPGSEINRIVIVPVSEEGGPPPSEDERVPEDPDDHWKTFAPTMKWKDRPDPMDANGFAAETLAPSSVISVRGLWEFVPYNTPFQGVFSPTFAADVDALRGRLLGSDVNDRESALDGLKNRYDIQFGATSPERNRISLILYGGPIYRSWRTCQLLSKSCSAPYPSRYPCFWRVNEDAPSRSGKSSILYTGDSYLNDPPEFDHLAAYFGPSRMSKIGVFQINHHGSKKNWHPGLAAKINPVYSVVTSNRSRHHPHIRVEADFKPFGFTQVDKSNSASFCGWMIPKSGY